MIVSDLKNSILVSAFKGELTKRELSDSNVNELLTSIQNEKNDLVSQGKIGKPKPLKEIEEGEIPFSIPKEWKWVRWGNLSNSIQYGLNAGAQNHGKAKLVRISDIQNNEVVWESVPYCDVEEKDINQYILSENDILFARTGGTVGKSVIVKNIPTDEPYVFAGYLIRSNYSSKVNYKYLKYFMESPLYWEQLRSGTIGSAQPNCNGQTLSNMILPFPSIEEQNRIVNRLDELFTKLDEIDPIEKELDLIKSSVSNEMTKSILNSAYSGSLISDCSTIDSWNESKLIKIADIYTGNSIPESIKKNKYMKVKEGYNYIGTKDLEFNHSFIYENGVKIPYDESNFKYANSNDILMCIEGGSAGKKIGILSEKVCFGNKLCKFSITSNDVLPKYLYYYLQSPVFLKNFYENLSGIIGGVSINKIKQIDIKYPSIEEQNRIVDKIEKLLPLLEDISKIVEN